MRGYSLHSKPCGPRELIRVTRKVNLADRSADYQCHSVFIQAEGDFTNLLGRADHGNVAAGKPGVAISMIPMPVGVYHVGDSPRRQALQGSG